jgi:hypothetical protein
MNVPRLHEPALAMSTQEFRLCTACAHLWWETADRVDKSFSWKVSRILYVVFGHPIGHEACQCRSYCAASATSAVPSQKAYTLNKLEKLGRGFYSTNL